MTSLLSPDAGTLLFREGLGRHLGSIQATGIVQHPGLEPPPPPCFLRVLQSVSDLLSHVLFEQQTVDVDTIVPLEMVLIPAFRDADAQRYCPLILTHTPENMARCFVSQKQTAGKNRSEPSGSLGAAASPMSDGGKMEGRDRGGGVGEGA